MIEINQKISEGDIRSNDKDFKIKQLILTELWIFCEKEFNADFENDWINGFGSKNGLSNRTDKFVDSLSKKILK